MIEYAGVLNGKDGYNVHADYDSRKGMELVTLAANPGILKALEGWHAYIFPGLARHLVPLSDYEVCDLGCGPGHQANFLAAFGCKRYVGVDACEHRIQFAKTHYPGSNREFVHADVCKFRSEEKFDLVWTCTVMQHMPLSMKLALVETIKSILKPDGRCLMYEGRVYRDTTLEQCEAMYAKKDCAAHMIPIPFSLLEEACSPRQIKQSGNFYEIW